MKSRVRPVIHCYPLYLNLKTGRRSVIRSVCKWMISHNSKLWVILIWIFPVGGHDFMNVRWLLGKRNECLLVRFVLMSIKQNIMFQMFCNISLNFIHSTKFASNCCADGVKFVLMLCQSFVSFLYNIVPPITSCLPLLRGTRKWTRRCSTQSPAGYLPSFHLQILTGLMSYHYCNWLLTRKNKNVS
jgi:hypothetical protein